MVESWGFTGIKPQSHRAHGVRTTETTIPEAIGGLFQNGWKGMLSVSVNSVPLWLIIVAEKSTLGVYGNKPQSRRAHRGRTTETTIAKK